MKVPVVIYGDDGSRKVIGEAEVDEKGVLDFVNGRASLNVEATIHSDSGGVRDVITGDIDRLKVVPEMGLFHDPQEANGIGISFGPFSATQRKVTP